MYLLINAPYTPSQCNTISLSPCMSPQCASSSSLPTLTREAISVGSSLRQFHANVRCVVQSSRGSHWGSKAHRWRPSHHTVPCSHHTSVLNSSSSLTARWPYWRAISMGTTMGISPNEAVAPPLPPSSPSWNRDATRWQSSV